MKVSSSSALLLAAAGTLETGIVHAITSPRLPSLSTGGPNTRGHQSLSSPSGTLGVDEDGNLVWCQEPTPQAQPVGLASATATSRSLFLGHVVAALRGGDNASGDRCADRLSFRGKPQAQVSPTEVLRGGSRVPRRGGGLRVDSEGNLFFSAEENNADKNRHGRSAAAVAAADLRGGELRVDGEGNFYSARQQPLEEAPSLMAKTAGLRRSRGVNHDSDAVVLAKNRGQKIRASPINDNKQRKTNGGKDDGNENPMAFIGYNNALMET